MWAVGSWGLHLGLPGGLPSSALHPGPVDTPRAAGGNRGWPGAWTKPSRQNTACLCPQTGGPWDSPVCRLGWPQGRPCGSRPGATVQTRAPQWRQRKGDACLACFPATLSTPPDERGDPCGSPSLFLLVPSPAHDGTGSAGQMTDHTQPAELGPGSTQPLARCGASARGRTAPRLSFPSVKWKERSPLGDRDRGSESQCLPEDLRSGAPAKTVVEGLPCPACLHLTRSPKELPGGRPQLGSACPLSPRGTFLTYF